MASRLSGINDETYETLFKKFYDTTYSGVNTLENYCAFNAIDTFTLKEKNLLFRFYKYLFTKLNIMKTSNIHYDKENDRYNYVDDDLVIPFNMISRICQTDKSVIDELESRERFGKCHGGTMSIAPCVPNSYVVTGFITIGDSKVLHTVLEVETDTQPVILDWTCNAEMPKSDYCALTMFEEITRFKGDLVKEDLDYAKALELDTKTYVTFRNEIMNDLEKNKTLFRK